MKETNKKTITIIAAVGLLFAIAVATGALFFISYNPYPDKIVSALSSGRYDKAIREYNEKYSNKTPDKKLIAALTNRLNNISVLFAKEEIDYQSIKEEIHAISKMNIAEIKILLNKSEDAIENIQTGKKAYALANKYYTNNDYFLAITEYKKITNTDDCNYFEAKNKLDECISAYKKEVLTKIDTLYQNKNIADALIMIQEALTIIPDDVELSAKKEALTLLRDEKENRDINTGISSLPSEPLPPQKISKFPVISSATTLIGNVLPWSNVNSARSFGADKVIDGYYDSCWCVSTSATSAVGAKIKINLSQFSTVSGIKIINGNLFRPEEDIFRSNGQLKHFTLSFSDGAEKSFTAPYNSYAANHFEVFTFNTPVNTDYIILTVNSYYPGRKYTSNVCIGEIAVF